MDRRSRMVLLLTLVTGCAPRIERVESPMDRPAGCPLTMPPGPEAADELARLQPLPRLACQLDLFDTARLIGDESARALLCSELAQPAEHGEAATRRVIETLAASAKKNRWRALAALLADDLAELGGGDPTSVAAHRKASAQADDPVAAAHALLSLYATCTRSLGDAASAPPWRRAAIANRCLYSLFDADPAPYFDEDPAARPPDPPWTIYLTKLELLLRELNRRAPRLRTLGDRLASDLSRLAEAIEQEGIAPPDLTRVGPTLPLGDESLPPYDRDPWLVVDRNMVVIGRARFDPRDHELVQRVERTLTLERVLRGSGKIVLFAPIDGRADVVDSLIELSRRAGADSFGLAFLSPLALRAPPGDAWSERPPDRRFSVVQLQLRAASRRDQPRELGARESQFTLLIAPDGATLFAKDGSFPLGTRSLLPKRLVELHRAFPGEVQLALAIDPTAQYRDVVEAVRLARKNFRRVAVVEIPHRPIPDRLTERLRGVFTPP